MNLNNAATAIRRNASWLLRLTVLFSAMLTGCAASPPILTLVDHGSPYDPNFDHGPDFRIELYDNGKVHYHGIADVNVVGDRYGQITPEQAQMMVNVYKKIYQNKQQMLARFYQKYNNRFSLSPNQRYALEEDKREYIDWREWQAYMLYHDDKGSSRLGPIGSRSLSILGILNQMLNLESWICYPKPDLKHDACPVLKGSFSNYQEYMKYLENEK